MKANQLFTQPIKTTLWVILIFGTIFLSGFVNLQPQEMGIPIPFWESSLGNLLAAGTLLTGLILIATGNPKGWWWIASFSFILAQNAPSIAKIFPIAGTLACLWTNLQWKSRGWFKNFSIEKK